MTKPNLGNKHTCKGCDARFFDLNKSPIVCPKCGEEVKVAKSKSKRPAAPEPEEAPSEPKKAEAPADDAPEAEVDPELEALEGDEGVDDLEEELEDDEDDDDLMEDTSDIGEDNDDMMEVLEHVDSAVEDK